jgi:hypothetical protein
MQFLEDEMPGNIFIPIFNKNYYTSYFELRGGKF